MTNNGWFTMNDVLNDLEAVTGRRTGNIDPRFTVTGEAPPPFHTPDEEDDFLEMYSKYTSKNGQVLQPDLSGIQQMLKMVNDTCNYPTYDENENMKQLNNEANTVVTISKLNPNVSEFVPRSLLKNNAQNNEKCVQEKSESNNCNINDLESQKHKESRGNSSTCDNLVCKQNNKTDSSHKEAKNDIDISKKIDVSNLHADEITNMKEKLIFKIIDTSNAACLKKKQERNLALASLLKLNAKPPVKLMPPDYYQTIPGNEMRKNSSIDIGDTNDTRVESDQNNNKDKSDSNFNDITTKECPDNGNSVFLKTDPVRMVSQKCSTSTTSGLNVANATPDPVLKQQDSYMHLTNEMKASVKKVDEWLNTPEKRKPKISSVHLGPVTFKRKGDVSVSPSLGSTEKIERPPSAAESFVPSSYANELSKKFAERNKARQFESEDMWTRLERQLKEKEKASLNQQ